MTDDYEKYEQACQAIRNDNAPLLEAFAGWLRAKGLSETTVRKHRDNVDFYVNECLLYEEATSAAVGVYEVGWFLGYWFIRKAMWASPWSIRSNAASLKKFYHSIIKFFLFDKLSSNQNSGVSRYNSRSCIARSFFILPAGPLS